MNYAQIRSMDVSDGPGIRIALYVSGCSFHCKNCYSQEQWNYYYGKEYTQETENKILEMLSSPHVSGLSLLGGDPLFQGEGISQWLIPLARKTKKLGKTVWIWSGFVWEDVMQTREYIIPEWDWRKELISLCDVWVDGQFVDSLKDLRLQYRGSSNQRVINVQESLKQHKLVLVDVLR